MNRKDFFATRATLITSIRILFEFQWDLSQKSTSAR